MGDEGRPLEIGLQGQVSNHLELRGSKARVVSVEEKALGPEHPHVATSLNNLAELYRAQGRYAEADRLDARAKMIRAKHAKENPAK